MIYDSIEQKQFILEAVKKFPCNYEQALQLANTFGQGIQDGQVIPLKDQQKADPADQAAPTPPNRRTRRGMKVVKTNGEKQA